MITAVFAVAAVIAASAAATAGATVRAASAATSPISYGGGAYGTYASVGLTVLSGASAPSGMGCVAAPGYHASNTLARVRVPGLFSTGALDSSSRSLQTSSGEEATSTDTVHKISILKGLIKIDTLTATSITKHSPGGFSLSAAGSQIAGLVIAGHAIRVTPRPNTTIGLPGVGTVVFNQQQRTSIAGGKSLSVIMVDVHVGVNALGIKVGAQIILGDAASALAVGATAQTISGDAYGSSVQLGDNVSSGPAWAVGMCHGTGGQLDENSTLGVTIPRVLTIGAMRNTAEGTDGGQVKSGEMTSTVTGLDLLSGLVSARLVKAETRVTDTGGHVMLSDAGSELVGLVVAGRRIAGDPAPNTEISVGNVHVWLHRVTRTAAAIGVRMIQITVTGANRYGLPPQTDIQVAAAFVGSL